MKIKNKIEIKIFKHLNLLKYNKKSLNTKAIFFKKIGQNQNLNKKAQVWGLDLLVASIIFLVGIMVLYTYAVNYSSQSSNQLDEFFYEGNLASQLLLTNEDQGILSEGKINQTKLDNFSNLDYSSQKDTLGVGNNFYFVIEDLEVEGNPVEYIGQINSTEIENLVRVTRLTIYKNKPTKFEMNIWK